MTTAVTIQEDLTESNCLENNIKHKHDEHESLHSLTTTIVEGYSQQKTKNANTPAFSLLRLPKEKKILLAVVSISNFAAFLCFSILAPFFPKEANTKNIDPAISGWIFACFALTQVILSPICGKLIPVIGSRFMYVSGLAFCGACTVIFGLLDYVETDKDKAMTFITLCFITRVLSAAGCSVFMTANFSILAHQFPENVGIVFGIQETFVGLGLMLGPAIGGLLYDVGGFPLPFYSVGGFLLLCVPVSLLFLTEQEEETHDVRSGSLYILLSSPRILAICTTAATSAMVWAALDPTLEPHLRVFDLDTAIVGLIFLIMSAVYAICSPITGSFADKMKDSRILMLVGLIGNVVGLLLIGPSPLLGFDIDYNELWLNMVALIILGVSCSMCVAPSFNIFNDFALDLGLEDNMGTHGIVAGVWQSAYALGEFIGPVYGGWMHDLVGFEKTMTYVAYVCAAMAVFLFASMMYDKYKSKCTKVEHGCNERTPLLGPTTD